MKRIYTVLVALTLLISCSTDNVVVEDTQRIETINQVNQRLQSDLPVEVLEAYNDFLSERANSKRPLNPPSITFWDNNDCDYISYYNEINDTYSMPVLVGCITENEGYVYARQSLDKECTHNMPAGKICSWCCEGCEVESEEERFAGSECAGCGKTDIERYHASNCPIIADDSSEEERFSNDVTVSCTECWHEGEEGTDCPTHGDTMYEEI